MGQLGDTQCYVVSALFVSRVGHREDDEHGPARAT